MSTTLTGYNNQITADDTYVLAAIDLPSRDGTVTLMLTAKNGYDGTATLKARPRGSSEAYQTMSYLTPGSSTPATTITPPMIIEIDAGAREVALVTTGRTTGQLQIDLSATNEL
jgi:hypothetical protein